MPTHAKMQRMNKHLEASAIIYGTFEWRKDIEGIVIISFRRNYFAGQPYVGPCGVSCHVSPRCLRTSSQFWCWYWSYAWPHFGTFTSMPTAVAVSRILL